MKTLARIIVLLLPLTSIASVTTAQAEMPNVMTCSTGGATTLILPITSITFDLPTGSPQGLFTVNTDFSLFNTLAEAHFATPTFDECSFTPGNGTSVDGLTISDVAAHADGGQQYAQITLSYNAISIGPASRVATLPAPKVPLTAEQKQRILADYLARLPKPPTLSK